MAKQDPLQQKAQQQEEATKPANDNKAEPKEQSRISKIWEGTKKVVGDDLKRHGKLGAYELGGLWTGNAYRGDLGLLTAGAGPNEPGVHGGPEQTSPEEPGATTPDVEGPDDPALPDTDPKPPTPPDKSPMDEIRERASNRTPDRGRGRGRGQ